MLGRQDVLQPAPLPDVAAVHFRQILETLLP